MTDLVLTLLWTALLVAGLGGAVLVRALGLPSTYVRDLLHVGAGVWVLGWPAWRSPVAPLLIVLGAHLVTRAVPWLAPRLAPARRLHDAVANGDERWAGLVRYTAAAAALTVAAFAFGPFPAAAAFFALALGDGLGGVVGRRFGAHRYRAPGGKPKSFEGSATVAVAAAAGAFAAGAWFGVPVSAEVALGVGLIAASAEAVAPAGTDNLFVPAAVWLALAWKEVLS